MIEKIVKEEQKPQIGGIYLLNTAIEDKGEKLFDGTPLKVISIIDSNYNLECEDYRGKKHFLHHDYLSCKKIETYPSSFKIVAKKIENIIADDIFEGLGKVFAVISFIVLAIYGGSIGLENEYYGTSVTNEDIIFILCSFCAVLFFGVISSFSSICWIDPLYTKENLKELKILLNNAEENIK